MKILWVSHFLPYPPKGGLLLRGYNLVRELSRYAAVDILAFNQPRLLHPLLPDRKDPEAVAIEELGRFSRIVGVENVPLSDKPWGTALVALRSLVSKYPYTINWLVSRSFSNRLARVLEQTRYDVVHLDTISLAYYRHLVETHSPGSALSLGHHNIESHMLLRRAGKSGNWLKRLYFLQEGLRLARYEKRHCPEFDLNIVCSDLDGQRLGELARLPRIRTIENGVDVEYFRPGERMGDPRKLIFVGTMNWYPNVDAMRFFLDSVWPLLTRLEPDVSMDIVGANPPDDLYEYQRKDARIKVHGFVDDVRTYLVEAGIYVCPIRDGGGTKLKVLDAFASGVPMVAHPVACEGIAVQDGRHVLLASEPDSYATKILELMKDEGMRRRLATEARKLVETHYSFSSIGRRLYEEFSSISSTNQDG
jgi:polysaccharide biosynthesis protein PslH